MNTDLRNEIERAVKALRYAAHPHPSPNADALEECMTRAAANASVPVAIGKIEGPNETMPYPHFVRLREVRAEDVGKYLYTHPLAGEQAGAVAVAWQFYAPSAGKWVECNGVDVEGLRKAGYDTRSLAVIGAQQPQARE